MHSARIRKNSGHDAMAQLAGGLFSRRQPLPFPAAFLIEKLCSSQMVLTLLLGRIAQRHGGTIESKRYFSGAKGFTMVCTGFLSPGLRALGEIAASIGM